MISDMIIKYAFEKYTDLEDKFDLKNEEPSEEFEEWVRELFSMDNEDKFYDWLLEQEEMEWSDVDENVIIEMINDINQYDIDNCEGELIAIWTKQKIFDNYAYVYARQNVMVLINYIKENYVEESESDADTEVEEWNDNN